MRYVASILCLMFGSLSFVVNGQQDVRQEKESYVVAPSEQILVTIASQPDCPLQLEKAKYPVPTEGGAGIPSYHVRNRGTKPIRSFTVGTPSSTWGWSEKVNGKLLMPGERLPDEGESAEIVPLTKELRNKLIDF